MLKWYMQPDRRFNELLYRARKVVVDEKLLERLARVPEAIVVSSFRTLEEQKAMVAKGVSKTLDSNHRRGLAVDVVNWEEVQGKMRAVGLINDISWDRNHFAYDGENAANKYPLYTVDNSTEYNPQKDDDMKPTKKLAEAYELLRGEKPGENMNEGEQDKFAKEIADTVKERDDFKRSSGECAVKLDTCEKRPPREVVKETTIEKPVEVIKEVEVEKEIVKVVYDSEMSAVEHFRMAVMMFLGLEIKK